MSHEGEPVRAPVRPEPLEVDEVVVLHSKASLMGKSAALLFLKRTHYFGIDKERKEKKAQHPP